MRLSQASMSAKPQARLGIRIAHVHHQPFHAPRYVTMCVSPVADIGTDMTSPDMTSPASEQSNSQSLENGQAMRKRTYVVPTIAGVDVSGYLTPGSTGDDQVVTKILVPGVLAGGVIGKGGGMITQIAEVSGAYLQMSRTTEFYPGTSDRVLLVSGSMQSVLAAIYLILDIFARFYAKPKAANEQLKLTIPSKVAGAIVGRNAENVRALCEESGAKIAVQGKPFDGYVAERITTISGRRDEIMRGVERTQRMVITHESYASYFETTVGLATKQDIVISPRTAAATSSAFADVHAKLSLFLHDEDVPRIMGRGGQNIEEIRKACKVAISIKTKADMDPNPKGQELVISGMYGNVKLAEARVGEQIMMNRAAAERERRQGRQ